MMTTTAAATAMTIIFMYISADSAATTIFTIFLKSICGAAHTQTLRFASSVHNVGKTQVTLLNDKWNRKCRGKKIHFKRDPCTKFCSAFIYSLLWRARFFFSFASFSFECRALLLQRSRRYCLSYTTYNCINSLISFYSRLIVCTTFPLVLLFALSQTVVPLAHVKNNKRRRRRRRRRKRKKLIRQKKSTLNAGRYLVYSI